MDGIKIEVTGNIAKVVESPHRITAGTVGLPIEFAFDGQWDGLKKTAVFRVRHDVKIVEDLETETTVPWELLQKPGAWLSVGVYGVNGDGSVAIPTIWANVRVIKDGADPDGDPSADPKLPVWQKLLDEVDDVQTDVETLQGDTKTLQTDVETLQGDTKTLYGDVDTLQTNVETLQGDVNGLHGDVGTLQGDVGNVQGLETEAKEDLVKAINEVNGIAKGGGVVADTTLTKEGVPADAKATGEAIKKLEADAKTTGETIADLEANISADIAAVKAACMYITPNDFYKDGDTDDTNAILGAINALEASGGGVLQLDAKKYIVGKRISITKPILIRGCNPKLTTLEFRLPEDCEAALHFVTPEVGGGIESLTLRSNKWKSYTGLKLGTGGGLDVMAIRAGFTVRNLIVEEFGVDGIEYCGGWQITLHDIYVGGCDGIGVWINGGDTTMHDFNISRCSQGLVISQGNTKLTNCKVDNCVTHTDEYAVKIYHASRCCITNLEVQYCRPNGIWLGGGDCEMYGLNIDRIGIFPQYDADGNDVSDIQDGGVAICVSNDVSATRMRIYGNLRMDSRANTTPIAYAYPMDRHEFLEHNDVNIQCSDTGVHVAIEDLAKPALSMVEAPGATKLYVTGRQMVDASKVITYPDHTKQYTQVFSIKDMPELTLWEGQTYTISFDTENTGCRCYIDPGNFVLPYEVFVCDGTRKVFTGVANRTKSNSMIVALITNDSTGAPVGNISNVMLEVGDVAHAYEDYTLQTVEAETDGTFSAHEVHTMDGYTLISNDAGVEMKATYKIDSQSYLDSEFRHIVGEWHEADADALFIVGNGTSDTDRKNAFAARGNGDIVVGGKIKGVGSPVDSTDAANKAFVENLVKSLNPYSASPEAASVTTYPTKAGIYRTVGTNIFKNMSVIGEQLYGTLVIFQPSEYQLHIYLDTWGNLYWGRTAGGSVAEPSAWNKALGEVLPSSCYGSTLPAAGTPGRIFFKVVG